MFPKASNKNTEYPDCFFMFPENLLIFDHVKQTMLIVVNVAVGDEPEADYLQAVNKIKEIIGELKKTICQIPEEDPALIEKYTDYIYNCTSPEFQEMVQKAKKYIRAGDIFQVVLSRKVGFLLKTDPLVIYRNLRSLNPSPYMF